MERIKKELEELKDKKQLRKIPLINSKKDRKIIMEGKELYNFASNDYLGISTKDFLREEFLSNSKHSFSSASARLLSGSSEEYLELEKTLAILFEKERALIFNTGYQCNLGVISTLIEKGDAVFSDKLNHASIIDGMRLSQGDFYRFKHLDYTHLEKLLSQNRNKYNRAIIVSESVFSMDGDVANIDKLIDLKEKYNCLLMIDEAHAFSCFGEKLNGYANSNKVDIITATFGKALGSFGAFCVANNLIIEYLINKARSFIFSTSIPPINIAWTNWLLTEKREYLEYQKKKLASVTSNVHQILSEKGINTISNSHIIPIILGENEKAIKVAEELYAKGYYVPAIRPPTVPLGTARLRFSLTSDTDVKKFEDIIDIINSLI